jgi:uncharacterized protein involved in response to NO
MTTQDKTLWQIFTAAPHRVMFFGGSLQLVATMLWWLTDLATRYGTGNPIPWSVAPNAAHLYLMIYGIFPFLMFGFLMTTFPRWMAGEEIPASRYVPAFLLMLLGNAVFYAGLLGNKSLLAAGVFLSLCGWAIAMYALLHVVRHTKPMDKRHPIIALIALALGWSGAAAYLAWLLSEQQAWLNFALQAGIWFFLLPVFFNIGHRMIPFFTASSALRCRIDRPDWPLWVILTCSAGHGALQLADASEWLWLVDAPLALTAFYLGYAWNLLRSLSVPMVAVLHIGVAWLAVAGLLFTLQSLTLFSSHGEQIILGLAPLHALTIGFFATVVLGMATRVTLGHSGMSINPQRSTWLLFAALQLAVMLRVLSEILPGEYRVALYLSAAIAWLACFLPWVVFYLPAYLKPRADGIPG